MSLENPFSSKPIHSQENQEEKITKEIEHLQLQYVARLWEKKIPLPEPTEKALSFEDLLEENGGIGSRIYWEYRNRTGDYTFAEAGESEPAQEFTRQVLSQIHEVYESDPDHWISKVDSTVDAMMDELPKGLKRQVAETLPKSVRMRIGELKQYDKKREKSGMLEFYVETSQEDDEKYGTKKGEEYIEIHFPDLYKQKNKNDEVVNLFSLDSLKKLAEDVSTKYPNVKSIHAVSWLLDTPVGKRMGFRSFPYQVLQRGPYFWGQFITQDGTIDTARAEQFLETGKPPFEMREGYIPIDEFLSKYLPTSQTETAK